MKEYRHLFWDLDGTIFDFEKCEYNALERTFSMYEIPFNPKTIKEYISINDHLWLLHENGLIGQDQLLVERFEKLFDIFQIDCSAEEVSKTYQESLTEVVYFEKNALDVIRELYCSYDMYIATNGNYTTQLKRIELSGIKEYFDDIFISGKIGIHKPNAKFFEYCFKSIPGIDKNKTLIIGDSLSSDMQGGINAGIHTCWYNPHNKVIPDKMRINYVINDLRELITIVI